MPYQRKLDREKVEWFTLADAVLHVMAAEGIHSPSPPQLEPLEEDKNVEPLEEGKDGLTAFLAWQSARRPDPGADALVQIRWALHDGEIPIRWLQQPWPVGSSYHPDTIFDPVLPVLSGPFWLHAEIIASEDYAVNTTDPLLFQGFASEWADHRRLRRLFLLRKRVVELWPVRENILAPTDKLRLTTQQATELVRNAARELYKSERPNILQAEQRIRELVPGTGRKLIRAVLSEEEFARLRKPAGNSSTRSKR